MSDNLTAKTYSAAYDYPITAPNGNVVKPTNGRCWFTSKERMQEMIGEGRIWFGDDGCNMPRLKRYLSDVQQGMTPTTLWKYDDVGHNQEARQELKKLFGGMGYFDGPKPQRLMQRILKVANVGKDDIVIDYFSGSSSTAQAIMDLNAENGGNTRYIMVQMPEDVEEDTDAYRNGFRTICDIGKERIRLAGKAIQSRQTQTTFGDKTKADVGFRVLKLDSSNMKDVYYSPNTTYQSDIENYTDNVRSDRTSMDLLFQCMLDLGIEPSVSISAIKIGGKEVFDVDNGYLLACFDADVSESVVTEIAKKKPVFAVMRDSSMNSDSTATNFEQIFKSYSPTTVRKVI
jgi:adenine-specific DNA-methyltransferase